VNAVERVVVRLTGSPTDAAAVCIRVILTVPVSVGAEAGNHIASSSRVTKFHFFKFSIKEIKQEALLWQRDCATRLSVEILQLQNIPFEH